MKTTNRIIGLPKNNRNLKKGIMSFVYLGLAILFLTSCNTNDDDETILIDRVIDGAELRETINQNRKDELQSFVIDADAGGFIEGEEGTQLYFSPNSFLDQNGNPVNGNVTIDLIEIYDKAKMLLTKMPTNGRRPNGDIETLVSGGEFYVNATQEGQQLELANQFQLSALTDEFDDQMTLFDGQNGDCTEDELECDIVWEEQEQAELDLMQRDGPDGTGVGAYVGFISNFGWTNIDRWYNDPRPKTVIYADVPDGFDETNCNVYISYDGEPTALALLDTYIEETGLFSEHYGLIPIGLEVHFIFVSIQNDQYIYAIQPATIEEDHLEVIGTTSTATEAELIALINGLP